MDYEKAFKEAYERASLRFGTNVANELFLEYKESKEERVRRGLIEYFYDWSKSKSYCWGIPVTDIISFLEKQGEQKSQRMVSVEAKENGYGESEDEKVINEIINTVTGYHPTHSSKEVQKMVDWLEQQKSK